MTSFKNVFAGGRGIIAAGVLIGAVAATLQFAGNPGNMGICMACFVRDITGALGLHRAGVVQYLRPEIPAFLLGSTFAALMFKEFRSRGGSAPVVRFFLGMAAMIGALVFLGCPWRAVLRLAGGDANAIVGIAGLASGVFIGTLFLKRGYSLGRSHGQTMRFGGFVMPVVAIALLVLRFAYPPVEGELKQGLVWSSIKGPGAAYAPVLVSLILGLVAGLVAQRSRFCTMGAFRDIFLFKHFHLFKGVLALFVVVLVYNLVTGHFNYGFEGQPVAHSQSLWNFFGMVTSGLAFALAGGCPGRQIILTGEGDGDAAVFVLGMAAGAAFAHNMALSSSPAGIGTHGMAGTFIALGFCLVTGFVYSKKS